MDRSALEYLAEELAKGELVAVDGRPYHTKSLHAIKNPVAAELTVTTLTGLVEYVQEKVEERPETLLVHVVNPTQVQLLGPMSGEFRQRDTFVTADCSKILPRLYLELQLGQEELQIMLRSAFVQDENRDMLLEFIARVLTANELEVEDDGITQKSTARTGVTAKGKVKVPSPITLAPYRTFTEVGQPASEFVFRMSEGPKYRMVEGDGGAWRREAMKRVKDYLVQHLGHEDGLTVIA